MIFTKRLFCCAVIMHQLCVLSLFAGSRDFVGTTGAQILGIVPDARSAAMGEAFCGVADDVNGVHYNPAGLALLDHTEIPLASNQWLEGISYQYIGYAYSFRDFRTSNLDDLGTIAVTFSDLNSGSIVGRDVNGNEEGTFRERDQLMTVAYGKTILERDDLGRIMLGASGKMITEDVKDASSSNVAFDAGALWRSPYEGLSFGVAVQNVGKKLNYVSSEVDLPSNIKAGVSYRAFSNDMLLAFDINDPAHAQMGYSVGAEYFAAKALALRVGYNSRSDEYLGFTTGLGFVLKQVDIFFMYARDIEIDYAFVPYGDLGNTHRLSVVLKLGAD